LIETIHNEGPFYRIRANGVIERVEPEFFTQGERTFFQRFIIQPEDLIKVFGKPSWVSRDSIVQYEYTLFIATGETACLFDFKEKGKAFTEIMHWTLAGQSISALFCFEKALMEQAVYFKRLKDA
jgi:hypothetical protein